jgi:3-oxoacyl-(acyl-carrier-protein) synthase
MAQRADASNEPIVITGIGLIASVGQDRETVWREVAAGRSGVKRISGLLAIPDNLIIGAPVDIEPRAPRQMKVTALCQRAAEEAIADAELDWDTLDRDRFACAISGHMGDTGFIEEHFGLYDDSQPETIPWWAQWMPNTTCVTVANQWGLRGPRICHSTACASGLIDILAAARAIRGGQCDIALAGSGESFHPLFAAGFQQMRVLAQHDDPAQACRPFDLGRTGFVMGEGAAVLVVERLDHARRRGAPRIYAEILGSAMHAEAHHVTNLDEESESLAHLITQALANSGVSPKEIDYVNVHGTGTQQNDIVETRGIRRAFGAASDRICVSAVKSMLGHLVNASGSVELAITALALRDGFVPPTANLTNQDPQCDLDCVPLVGRKLAMEKALKISVAFGGHLVAAVLRRWEKK